jgi:hypothetical protein
MNIQRQCLKNVSMGGGLVAIVVAGVGMVVYANQQHKQEKDEARIEVLEKENQRSTLIKIADLYDVA